MNLTLPLLGKSKLIDPDKLLLKKYKLSKAERIEMLIRSILLSQVAVLVGSAIYYLFTQTHYLVQHGQADGSTASFVNIWLKKPWDNLPVYLDHAFGTGWFERVMPSAVWDTARHDVRHVLIGFLAALLIGSLTVGLKKYNRAGLGYMLGSVPLAFLAATATAAAGIAFFAWHPVASWFNHTGTNPDLPYAGQFIGSGAIQLTLIGVLAGIAAKMILNRTFATLQLMSIERNIAQGDTVSGIRKYIYPAVYRKRFRLIEDKVANDGYTCSLGNKWLGFTISAAIPVLALLTACGIYLNYFGPAVGAH